jgi:hypothetical protein
VRVLLDTNILIPREHDWVVPESLTTLIRMIAERKDVALIHPVSFEEIGRYQDERRRDVVLSKLASYPQLSDPPNPIGDSTYVAQVGFPQTRNSAVDNKLLYAVYRNAVDLLITEDQGIHAKSIAVGCEDRVLTILEAVRLFGTLLPKEGSRAAPASVRLEYLHNISLTDPFFDSMRIDYLEFDRWFSQKSREGRRAWVHRYDTGSLAAFMLLKEENEPISLDNKIFAAERRLKICTLKVSRTGLRIGELLLKLAFEFATNNSINSVYLTAFPAGKEYLLSLITHYGFVCVGRNQRGEDLYLKRLCPPSGDLCREDISRLYYPTFYDGPDVNKYVLPIQPRYHQRLFPSWKGSQALLDFDQGMLPEGNAITKAYLCNSPIATIKLQDIVLFYRSEDVSAITSLGVVQDVVRAIDSLEKVMELAGKRIVYAQSEIESMISKHAVLILFRWHLDFQKDLPLRTLLSLYLLRAAPQSIVSLSHRSYLTLKREGGFENSLAISQARICG